MPDGSALKTQVEFDSELANDFAELSGDPYKCVLYSFPWGEEGTPLEEESGPYEWQKDILQDVGKGLLTMDEAIRMAVASGHGIGKSALVAMLIHWAMSTMAHTRGTVTAGTEGQLSTKTQPEVAKWFNMAINAHWWDVSATKVSHRMHPTSWRVDFVPWNETRPDSFAGLHNKRRRVFVVFDEASSIADIIWETVEGALTDEDTELLWFAFGNPVRNEGQFRQCFGKQRDRWNTRQIDSRTVPGTNKKEIEGQLRAYGEDSDFFRVRVRGVFPRASSMQLIGSDLVESARSKACSALESEPIVLGVDIARGGDDQSVIAIRQGRDASSRPWKRYRVRNTMTIASEVARVACEVRADAIFIDATGIGAGVYDRVEQLKLPAGCEVYEVNFGSKSDKDWIKDGIRAANKRAEMWWNMRTWLARGSIPDEQEIEDDLIGTQYGYNSDSSLLLEKKEDMKKRGLASPDNGDALALTFAYHVAPKQFEMEQAQRAQAKRSRARQRASSVTGY